MQIHMTNVGSKYEFKKEETSNLNKLMTSFSALLEDFYTILYLYFFDYNLDTNAKLQFHKLKVFLKYIYKFL